MNSWTRSLTLARSKTLKKLCRAGAARISVGARPDKGADMRLVEYLLASPNVVSVTIVRVRLHSWRVFDAGPEHDYRALVIRTNVEIFYLAKGVVVPIKEYEAQRVVENPFMYYFSTALKLHCRIERAEFIWRAMDAPPARESSH